MLSLNSAKLLSIAFFWVAMSAAACSSGEGGSSSSGGGGGGGSGEGGAGGGGPSGSGGAGGGSQDKCAPYFQCVCMGPCKAVCENTIACDVSASGSDDPCAMCVQTSCKAEADACFK